MDNTNIILAFHQESILFSSWLYNCFCQKRNAKFQKYKSMMLYKDRLYLTADNISCCTSCYCCSATNLQWCQSVWNCDRYVCFTVVTTYGLVSAAHATGRRYLHAESNRVKCCHQRTILLKFGSTVYCFAYFRR
jgi:hypothetical protein